VGASAAHNQGANKSNGEDLYDKLSDFVVAFCDKTCQVCVQQTAFLATTCKRASQAVEVPLQHTAANRTDFFFLSFCCVLQELEAVLDEELLHHYNKRWTFFLFSRRVMSHTAEYINRQFVTREQDSHHRVLKLHDVRWPAECNQSFLTAQISIRLIALFSFTRRSTAL
jgi:hypothetical protein